MTDQRVDQYLGLFDEITPDDISGIRYLKEKLGDLPEEMRRQTVWDRLLPV